MSTILMPKDITGSTRFSLDFKLTFSMFKQLLTEFHEKSYDIQTMNWGAKLINYSSKQVIEINREFIAFSPILDEVQKEEVRKRIYKHVAKRAEVYTNNSFENLHLAKKSLLGEELRSCASLLYYAYHKFFNGQLYKFLNASGLEDFQIEINEMEHYTSAIFHRFQDSISDEIINLTQENYREIFCTNGKKKAANPLVLKKYLFYDNNKELLQTLDSYISFLLVKIANIKLEESDCLEKINQQLAIFHSKEIDKTTTEEKVVASILTCIQKSILYKEKKLLWTIYAVSLRLYWLRQTADYDFDFEVNTSVREMSLLLLCVNHILENIQQGEIDNDNSDLESKLSSDASFLKNESAEIDDIKEPFPILNTEEIEVYFNFPEEILPSEEVSIFATKLHLNAYFNKDLIIDALNFTPYMSNLGKYFKFNIIKKFSIELYLHINDHGRWTFWFEKSNKRNLNQTDLQEAIEIFFSKFFKSYKRYHEVEFEKRFLSTKPIICEYQAGSASPKNLAKSLEDFYKNRMISSLEVKARLAELLKYTFNKEGIIFKSINFSIDITVPNLGGGLHNTSSLPRILNDKFYSKGLESQSKKVYIDILLLDEEVDYNEKEINRFKAFKVSYENLINDYNEYLSSGFIEITSLELEELLSANPEFEEIMKRKFSDMLNDIGYKLIEEEKAIDESSYEIIEEAIQLGKDSAFPSATKGFWFLRNNGIDMKLALEEGSKWYKKALMIEKKLDGKNLKDLYQKFNLELCRFYLLRKNDKEKAYEKLLEGLRVGEESFFYKEALEYKEHYFEDEVITDISLIEIEEILQHIIE